MQGGDCHLYIGISAKTIFLTYLRKRSLCLFKHASTVKEFLLKELAENN